MATDGVMDSGTLLKKARQAANISEQEMAERLNMSVRYLKALERNDRKALPAVVFVRGYILSYARELHLDPEPLLAAFRLEKAEPAVKPVQPAAKPGLKARSPGARSARVAAVVLVLLALAAALLMALDWRGRQNFSWDYSILFPSEDSAAEIVAEGPAVSSELSEAAPSEFADVFGAEAELESEPLDIAAAGEAELESEPPDIAAAGEVELESEPLDIAAAGEAELESEPLDIAAAGEAELESELPDIAAAGEAELESELPDIAAAGEVELESEPLDIAAAGEAEPESGPSAIAVANGAAAPPSEVADDAAQEAPPGMAEIAADPDLGAAIASPNGDDIAYGPQRITPTGDEELWFEFSEDCWVEVQGGDEQLLYNYLHRQGDTLNLVGQGPFRILLGYSPGVQLVYNGERVPLAPHSRNGVASLVLGQ